jgi:hypothetical protein
MPRTKPATPPLRPCHFIKVPIEDEVVDQIEMTCMTLGCTRFALFVAMYQVLCYSTSYFFLLILAIRLSSTVTVLWMSL